MTKPRLTYFDAPISRGEECRLALYCAGVDFDDHRIKRETWAELKPSTPFGALPVLEWPGHAPLAQSNAILVLIGRMHGLHPSDPFEAARHEAMMGHVEDIRAAISPSMRIADDAQRRAAREHLAANVIPAWARFAEAQITATPFFGGDRVQVVDFKIHLVVKWITGGALDHIPTSVLDAFPKLVGVSHAVREHEAVKRWYARG